jgi:hypothetical protein
MADHPDHEQLAALQAGDGDRRQRNQVAAHVAGCPSCAEVVAAVEQARVRLALLGEPELPAGLHQRLADAVDAEAARAGRPARRPAWYRRPAAWGAAAAAILLAAIVVPLLDRPDGLTTAGGDAGGGQARETAGAPMHGGADTAGPSAGGLPVVRLGGELSAERLRAALAGDPAAMQAYRRATAAGRADLKGKAQTSDLQVPSTAAARGGATAPQQACLAAAIAKAGGRPLVAAFMAEGTYQGRPATALVTASTGQPSQAELWVFPRGNCSDPPLAGQRIR